MAFSIIINMNRIDIYGNLLKKLNGFTITQ